MTDDKNHQRLYLGLDLSTEELKGVVIDEDLNIIAEELIRFNDQSLFSQTNETSIKTTTAVLIFLEAFDILFQKLRDQKKFDFTHILGISGCAQQHGSIYWKNKKGLERLKNFHFNNGDMIEISDIHDLPKNPFLIDLLKSSFSHPYCELWNILELSKKRPDIFEQTECIQFLSNFLASILIGDYAPIDLSDGSRLNIFDIHQHKWSKEYLNIYKKKFVHPRTIIGHIAKYFIERYAFNNHCQIVTFTGDNPSSYYALASDRKTVVISLGINDIVMASISTSSIPQENFDGDLFINPLINQSDIDLLMIVLRFQNGSLIRERVSEEVASKDWQQISELLCQTPPSNHGYLGYFFDNLEILPENLQGRFYFNSIEQQIENLEPACKVRALLEGQCLAKRLYLQRANIDLANNVDRIVITGGASVNIDFLQIVADIFNKPAYAALAPNSACFGSALRAFDISNSKNSTIK